jgi:hypothetical protein
MKPAHDKSAKVSRKKVSAVRRQSAVAPVPSMPAALPDDEEIAALALDLGKLSARSSPRSARKGSSRRLSCSRIPYMLDFLGLADTYSERDLESAILRELERFLLELGVGFTFVERQKRIVLDGDDYYLDLLFFHRRMRRLVVIELKIDDFKPAYSGQMELYLRWLDRHERQPSEEAPLGIILCAGKKRETVEYLDLNARGIHVAEYLTELPPREVLRDRLHRAIEAARNRLVLDATPASSNNVRRGCRTSRAAP